MGLSSVGPEKAWRIAWDQLWMDMLKPAFDTWVRRCEFVSFSDVHSRVIGWPAA